MFKTLKSSKAAIDLASIMVGVVILSVISGVIAATIFLVIPWAQENAAKQQVQAVNTAQQAYAGITVGNPGGASLISAATLVKAAAPEGATYGDLEDLVNGGYLNTPVDPEDPTMNAEGTMCVVTLNGGTGYRTEVLTPSGEIYFSTDVNNDTQQLPADQESTCFPTPAEPDSPHLSHQSHDS